MFGEMPEDGTPCPTCGEGFDRAKASEAGEPVGPALEVDPTFAADKAAKAAAFAEANRPKRSSGGLVLALVMIAALGVIIMMVFQRQPTARGADDPEDGVQITVTSPKPGVQVTVDGAPAGKTPTVIKLRGRTRPLKIEGNGVTVEINPDRDQVVNLVRPK